MKKIALELIFIIIFLGIASAACPSEMVSYWKFENNVLDTMNSHNGINYGISYAGGKIGNAGDFNGASYVFVADLPAEENRLRLTTGTISFWIKPSQEDVNEGDYAMIINKNRVAESYYGYFAGFDNGANPGKLLFGSVFGQVLSSTTFLPDLWYYVILTANASGRYIYVNGRLDSEIHDYTFFPPGYAELDIGRKDPAEGQHYLDGSLDELAIYDKTLTTREFLNNYNSVLGKDYCTNPVPLQACTETDAGEDYNYQGETCRGASCMTDYCYNSDILIEYYCLTGTDRSWRSYTCPAGCVNGACIDAGRIAEVYWADANEQPIQYANNLETVKLIAKAAGIPDGNLINFKVYHNLDLLTVLIYSINSGKAVYSYTIPNNLAIGEKLRFNASNFDEERVANMSGWLTIGTAPACQCSDGTACNSCSANKPKYCDATGNLIDKCSVCGCDSGNCLADETCEATSEIICNDYVDQAICESAPSDIAVYTVETYLNQGSGFCGLQNDGCTTNECQCKWNSGCEGGYTTTNACSGDSGDCSYFSSTLKECDVEPNLGFRVLNITKIWTGEPALTGNCTGSWLIERKCLESALLGFFNYSGFLIVVLLIIIYFIFRRK